MTFLVAIYGLEVRNTYAQGAMSAVRALSIIEKQSSDVSPLTRAGTLNTAWQALCQSTEGMIPTVAGGTLSISGKASLFYFKLEEDVQMRQTWLVEVALLCALCIDIGGIRAEK